MPKIGTRSTLVHQQELAKCDTRIPCKFNIDTTNKAIEKVCPFQICNMTVLAIHTKFQGWHVPQQTKIPSDNFTVPSGVVKSLRQVKSAKLSGCIFSQVRLGEFFEKVG